MYKWLINFLFQNLQIDFICFNTQSLIELTNAFFHSYIIFLIKLQIIWKLLKFW